MNIEISRVESLRVEDIAQVATDKFLRRICITHLNDHGEQHVTYIMLGSTSHVPADTEVKPHHGDKT